MAVAQQHLSVKEIMKNQIMTYFTQLPRVVSGYLFQQVSELSGRCLMRWSLYDFTCMLLDDFCTMIVCFMLKKAHISTEIHDNQE